jgi:hypothetical protein
LRIFDFATFSDIRHTTPCCLAPADVPYFHPFSPWMAIPCSVFSSNFKALFDFGRSWQTHTTPSVGIPFKVLRHQQCICGDLVDSKNSVNFEICVSVNSKKWNDTFSQFFDISEKIDWMQTRSAGKWYTNHRNSLWLFRHIHA